MDNKIKYLLALDRARRARLLEKHEKELIEIYNRAFLDTYGKLKDLNDHSATKNAKIAFINQIYTQLQELNEKYLDQVTDSVLDTQAQIMEEIVGMQNSLSDAELAFIRRVHDICNITNRNALEMLLRGEIYKDGRGLSSRLWSTVASSGMKIDEAVKLIVAQGIGAVEGANLLAQFGKNHRVWDRYKIKELLGPGYSFTGGIDYEALRLLRTTYTHLAQLATMESAKVNPYISSIKWHSVHAGGRTCDVCLSRDNKIYPIKDVPFDHPNGMCWNECVFSIDGREVTPAEMAEDMGKWLRNEPNSGLMDKIYK